MFKEKQWSRRSSGRRRRTAAPLFGSQGRRRGTRIQGAAMPGRRWASPRYQVPQGGGEEHPNSSSDLEPKLRKKRAAMPGRRRGIAACRKDPKGGGRGLTKTYLP
jgi:hypothetical protein